MSERIKELIAKATNPDYDGDAGPANEFNKEKFAELLVKECADAADMAYDAQCKFPGDYVGEYMGYGVEHGITAWRCKQ